MAQFSLRKVAGKIVIPLIKHLFGFCAFSIDEDDKTSIKFTDFLVFLTHFTFGSFISVYSWMALDFHSIESSIILVGNHITFNCTIMIGLATMIFSTILKDSVWKLVVNVDDVDQMVCEFHQYLNES